ncbi:hypothetical protein MTO96_046884, partial [Rhipicephalus appendiculatus]
MVTGSSDTETVPVEEQQPVPKPAPAVDVESSDIAANPSPSSPADTTVPGDTHSSQGQQTARNEPVRTH